MGQQGAGRRGAHRKRVPVEPYAERLFGSFPEQMFGNPVMHHGERGLLWAMLIDAVELLQKHHRSTEYRSRRLVYEVSVWMLSEEQRIFSFLWLCDHLELDCDWIRTVLAEFFVYDCPTPQRRGKSGQVSNTQQSARARV